VLLDAPRPLLVRGSSARPKAKPMTAEATRPSPPITVGGGTPDAPGLFIGGKF
jgi:hypothetical protein